MSKGRLPRLSRRWSSSPGGNSSHSLQPHTFVDQLYDLNTSAWNGVLHQANYYSVQKYEKKMHGPDPILRNRYLLASSPGHFQF